MNDETGWLVVAAQRRSHLIETISLADHVWQGARGLNGFSHAREEDPSRGRGKREERRAEREREAGRGKREGNKETKAEGLKPRTERGAGSGKGQAGREEGTKD